MDLTPTDEQRAIREATRGFLGRLLAPDRRGAVLDAPDGWVRAAWSELAGQGLLGLSVLDSSGGEDLGLTDEAVVAEEVAAALAPVPFQSAVGLALPVLIRADASDDLLGGLVDGDLIATLAWAESDRQRSFRGIGETTVTATRDGVGWFLEGRKRWVPDGDRADLILVPAQTHEGLAIFAVPARASGVSISATTSIDSVRSLADLVLETAPGRLLVPPARSEDVLDEVAVRGLMFAVAASVGITQRVLDITVAYAGERKQFGRPIGAYQAVSHQLADVYVQLELSRSLLVAACLAVDEQSEQKKSAAAAAASKALGTAVRACETAIQLHGGIGVTWESILHRYLKHAIALEAFGGRAAELRRDAIFGAGLIRGKSPH
jgi:alkylation response protein AidB-like acyl-CoA dehydrogenase